MGPYLPIGGPYLPVRALPTYRVTTYPKGAPPTYTEALPTYTGVPAYLQGHAYPKGPFSGCIYRWVPNTYYLVPIYK